MSDSQEPRRRLKVEGLPSGFTIVRLLGRSPLSEVFLVADDQGRLRALKILRASAGRDPRIRKRWEREVQLLAELRHPNLIRSYGSFEVQDRPALLLEYIEGNSLRDRLRDGPLGWEEACRIGVQVARALQLLHRRGALHRDVKPHNVLLDPKRGAILADLGLVRRKEDPTLTAPGAALGSPAYMSPEQARDPSALGPEADVYSLGATLHHALSGSPPFLGNGVGEVIHRVLHLDPEPLPDSVPEPLAAVLRTALAKDPRHRYARARDFAKDLERVLIGLRPHCVSRGARRTRLRVAAATAAVLLVAAGAAYWLSRPDEARPERAAGGPALTDREPPESVEDTPGPPPEPRAPDGADAEATRDRETRAEFSSWVLPYQQAIRRYASANRLRAAIQEIDLLEEAALPAGVDAHFRRLREALVFDSRQGILAKAEEAAVRAERLVDAERERARGLIEEERFDGAEWNAEVQAAWEREGLPVEDLPLGPSGADPARYLESARLALDRRAEEVLTERAGRAVEALRAATARKLREGRFAEAKADWDQAKPAYLQRSLEGRREAVRVQRMYALQDQVRARLNEMVGQRVRLLLRFAAVEGELLAPLARGEPHRLDVGPRRLPEPVDLLRLDPDSLPEFLLVDSDKELRWLIAQLYWCQARVGRALEVMRPLQGLVFPPEQAPGFWVAEWEREQGQAAEANRPLTEPGGASPPVSTADPLASPAQRLAAEWAPLVTDGEVRALDGAVEIAWDRPRWDGEWQYSLRWDRRRWSLEAWEVRWRLPPDAVPPRMVRWLGWVELLTSPGLAPSLLRVDKEELAGFGMVPGASQTLSWRDGSVFLDGMEVGSRVAVESSRLELSGRASDGFRPDRVWIRAVHRPRD